MTEEQIRARLSKAFPILSWRPHHWITSRMCLLSDNMRIAGSAMDRPVQIFVLREGADHWLAEVRIACASFGGPDFVVVATRSQTQPEEAVKKALETLRDDLLSVAQSLHTLSQGKRQ